METLGKGKNNVKKILVVIVVVFVLTFGVTLYYVKTSKIQTQTTLTQIEQNLPTMNLSQLAFYDGTNPSKPIYIGLNGKVYDVSAGRSFYELGGTYHYLAGKDSSAQLNLIGGDIIAKKYPVIAILSN